MKKKFTLLAVLLMAMTLVACGGGNKKEANNKAENATKEESTEAKTDVNVGFVTDEGGVNDQSFNQGVWEGLQKAQKELGIKAEYIESKDTKDYTPNLETFADQEKNIIVGAGYKMGGNVAEAAECILKLTMQ